MTNVWSCHNTFIKNHVTAKFLFLNTLCLLIANPSYSTDRKSFFLVTWHSLTFNIPIMGIWPLDYIICHLVFSASIIISSYHTLSEAIGSLGCRRNSSSGSWLNCNLWLDLDQLNQLAFQLIQLDITGIHGLNAPDSGISSWVNGKSPESASFEHLSLPCI